MINYRIDIYHRPTSSWGPTIQTQRQLLASNDTEAIRDAKKLFPQVAADTRVATYRVLVPGGTRAADRVVYDSARQLAVAIRSTQTLPVRSLR